MRGIANSILSIVKYISVAAITVFLPFDFLYRFNAFVDYLRPGEIIINIFEVALFCFLYFGVFLGGIIGLLTVIVLFPFARKERTETITHAVGSTLLFALIVFSFFRGAYLWATEIIQMPEVLKIRLVLGVLTAVVVLMTLFVPALRQRLFTPLRGFAEKAFTVILFMAGVGACFVIWRNISAPLPPMVKAGGKGPNVILISFDAMTAEDLHLYGYPLQTTPFMETLAKESVVFDQALSCSNLTKPGTACIELGKYPATSGIMHQHGMLDKIQRNDALSAELKKLGYATASISGNILASPYDIGVDRHFNHLSTPWKGRGIITGYFEKLFYESYPFLARGGYNSHWWFYHIWEENICTISVRLAEVLASVKEFWWHLEPQVSEQVVFEEGLKFIKEHKEPFYLRLHLFQPHWPYLPSVSHRRLFLVGDELDELDEQRKVYRSITYPDNDYGDVKKLRLRYDEYIHETDMELGGFVASLKEMGVFNDSIFIVTADHGEMFEKGFLGHGGNSLYRPEVHIPLLLHEPGRTAGKRVAQPVSQVDIAATALDLAGTGKSSYMDGVSLRPFLKGGDIGRHPVFSMYQYGDSKFKPFRDGSICVLAGDAKYIHYYGKVREMMKKDQLFSIAADPSENLNLLDGSPDTGKELLDEINNFIAKHKLPSQ